MPPLHLRPPSGGKSDSDSFDIEFRSGSTVSKSSAMSRHQGSGPESGLMSISELGEESASAGSRPNGDVRRGEMAGSRSAGSSARRRRELTGLEYKLRERGEH